MHLPLDEKQGNKVSAAMAKKPAGTIQGKAAWVAGKFGGAIALDGGGAPSSSVSSMLGSSL